MKYLQRSFSLPASNGKMTQTEYEIAVGIRNADGSLKDAQKCKKS
jgi:hypothetical protein